MKRCKGGKMCHQVGQTGIGAPGCWVDGYYSLNYTQIYINSYIYIYIYMHEIFPSEVFS